MRVQENHGFEAAKLSAFTRPEVCLAWCCTSTRPTAKSAFQSTLRLGSRVRARRRTLALSGHNLSQRSSRPKQSSVIMGQCFHWDSVLGTDPQIEPLILSCPLRSFLHYIIIHLSHHLHLFTFALHLPTFSSLLSFPVIAWSVTQSPVMRQPAACRITQLPFTLAK